VAAGAGLRATLIVTLRWLPQDSICPVLEERAGEKIDVDHMTLL
jgi:hypothetical protein